MMVSSVPSRRHSREELNEPGYSCCRIPPSHVRATTQTGGQYHEDEARSHLSRIAEARDGSSAGELCLYFAAQPRLLEARRDRSDRRKAWLADLQSSRPHGDDAQQGGRVSPLRLERLLVGVVAAHRARVPRAALPHNPRHPVLADLCRGYEA